MENIRNIIDYARLPMLSAKKSTEISNRTSHQYDLLSQEMAASDADAEPTVDYNRQNQDLYAYIEH